MRGDGICGEKITNLWNEVRLVGRLWGGSALACIKWKNEYKSMLEKYFDKDTVSYSSLETEKNSCISFMPKDNIEEFKENESEISGQSYQNETLIHKNECLSKTLNQNNLSSLSTDTEALNRRKRLSAFNQVDSDNGLAKDINNTLI